ncbi:MAG: GNAT family N-acetyltransferase [Candidatus Parcubacteria bacterium]|nr:GNAT family N-acetyltransferase [Candidatus Parcubacteria bacterium]
MKNRIPLLFFSEKEQQDDNKKCAVLRPFKEGEETEIKELFLSVLAELGFSYDPKMNFDLDNLQLVYRQGFGEFFVIEYEGKIVGTVGIQDKGEGVSYWRRLAVLKEYRGNGWGGDVVLHFLGYTRSIGFLKATFDTLDKSHMREKYESLGFVVVDEIQEGENVKYLMECLLN